ncbi:MAG: GNAT family N-acetyltransferase [Nitrospinales bacterium]|nr:GNAT family N-acetyltransferase [Nitrospinales bacterium]
MIYRYENMKVNLVSVDDDIKELIKQINLSSWDEQDDIEHYSIKTLLAYLEKQDTVFLACYTEVQGIETLTGIASGRLEQKPYDFSKWLYIDEVDTCSNHRKKGVATAMMQTFLKLAKEKHCEEVWLCTERENLAARKLYESLNPNDVGDIIGYTFKG